MKICPNCNSAANDTQKKCFSCGYSFDKAYVRQAKRESMPNIYRDSPFDTGGFWKKVIYFIGIVLIAAIAVILARNEGSKSSSTTTEQKKVTTESRKTTTAEATTTEATTEAPPQDDFVSALSEYTGDALANQVYGVITNDLGFEKIAFGEQLGESGNYKIWLDNTSVALTAMPEVEGEPAYIRIFVPDTKMVLYDDGEVLMTESRFAELQIDSELANIYYTYAKMIVDENLKNPGSSKYAPIGETSFKRDGNLVAVSGTVTAKNSFDAKVETPYTVQFTIINFDEWTYSLNYINIGGSSLGQFIEYEY